MRERLTHCPKCGSPRTGKRSLCNACHNAANDKWRRAHLSEVNERGKQWKRDHPSTAAWVLLNNAKNRAKKAGLEFTITQKDIEGMLAIGRCAATRVRFDMSKCDTHHNPHAPSLDRISPKFGYVPGNCRLVTWIYNRTKGPGTDLDVQQFARDVLAAITTRETG